MRTAEVINLLRSKERNGKGKQHLSTLDGPMLMHVLVELCNWLLVELRKYRERGDLQAEESQQQVVVRGQMRQTLQAILLVLDSSSSGSRQGISLDNKTKNKVLEGMLTPILIGIMPVGSRGDATDVQQMCAKILCYCTNSSTRNLPFSPQEAAKRMMTLGQESIHARDQESRGLDGSHEQLSVRSRMQIDVAVGLSSLLRSPLIKLQDYGLRILSSHHSLLQYDVTWECLGSLRPVLESLNRNLERALEDAEVAEDDLSAVHGQLDKDLEATMIVEARALGLVQVALQEAGRLAGGSATMDGKQAVRLQYMKQAAPVELLVEIWTNLQHIVLFDTPHFQAREKMVLMTTAAVYWVCWLFQDTAVEHLMTQGSDTLLAWYGTYILPHSLPAQVGSAARPSGTLGQSQESSTKDVLKHHSSVLEYLVKLIQTMVTSKQHQPGIFALRGRIGWTLVRRTLEFLEGIKEVRLPAPEDDTLDQGESSMTVAFQPGERELLSHAVESIQAKPGILEAMFALLSACLGLSRELDDLVLQSRLIDILLLILADVRALFALPNIPPSTVRRIHQSSLNILVTLLKREVVPGLEDISADHWKAGCEGLVELIMRPLEREMAEHIGQESVSPMDRTFEDEIGLKGLRVYRLFWQHNAKARGWLSDAFGPRFYRLEMIRVLLESPGEEVIRARPNQQSKWRLERCLLLLESMVYFGVESSVRINMRERWSALLFMVALLSASMEKWSQSGFSVLDRQSRMVAQKCLLAFQNFWFDQAGMMLLVSMEIPSTIDATALQDHVQLGFHLRDPSIPTISIVPVLLAILVPPRIKWTSDLMLGSWRKINKTDKLSQKRPLWHPLFERGDSLLSEAASLLGQLSQLDECQKMLVSKAGAVWVLSRMMVENSLTSASTSEQKTGQESPTKDLLEKSLFDILLKIMSAENLVKDFVSNNTITEVFAAVLDTDSIRIWPQGVTKATIDQPPTNEKGLLDVAQFSLHQDLRIRAQWAMESIEPQLNRLFQYLGGNRPTYELDDSAETVYWLREHCAVVSLYNSEGASWKEVDPAQLLELPSAIGIVCRMLTLELDYEVAEEGDQKKQDKEQDLDLVNAQYEEAILRKFSAGLAIQSLCWASWMRWVSLSIELQNSYADVETVEWKEHVAALVGDPLAVEQPTVPVTFLVQGQAITFPDRAMLSRSSTFFERLLMGEFKERDQDEVVLRDLDPQDFEMLMQVLQESKMTVQYLLPEDLPMDSVLRLMVCAERFLMPFIRRLAEAWVLQNLRMLEVGDQGVQTDSDTEDSSLKRPWDSLDPDDGLNGQGDILPPPAKSNMAAGEGRPPAETADSHPSAAPTLADSLLMVYDYCSNACHGNLFEPTHPFHDLVWEVLRRIMLRLGAVSILPRFRTILDQGGEEKVLEFLRIVHTLVVA